MLDKDGCNGNRADRPGCQASQFCIHFQSKLQDQQNQNTHNHRYGTDDRHRSGVGNDPHKFALPEQIGMLLSVQPAQITLDQFLIVLRLRQLFKSLLHLFLQALHLPELFFAHPVFPFLIAGLLLLKCIDLLCPFCQFKLFFLGKGLDFLHIL